MTVKTKPEPGYTYDVQYGPKSPQPGLVERVGDVRLAELGEEGEDFAVVASYQNETPDEEKPAAAAAPENPEG